MNTNNQDARSTSQNLNGGDHTPEELAAANLTAYALGQLPADERAAFEQRQQANNSDTAIHDSTAIQSISAAIVAARRTEPAMPPSAELQAKITDRLNEKVTPVQRPTRPKRFPVVELLVSGGIALVLLALLMPA